MKHGQGETVIIQSNNMKTKLKLASWNCRGVKSKSEWLNFSLLENDWDIILLQETWLCEFENNFLNSVNEKYDGIAVSSVKSNNFRRGRPYGGIAILWKKTLSPYIQSETFNDPRICAITLNINDSSFVIVSCYLPTADYPQDQTEYFSKIAALCETRNEHHVIVAGDFNCDKLRNAKKFNELSEAFELANLKSSDISKLPLNSVTYNNDALSAFSWIDHVFSSDNVYDSVDNFKIIAATPSDHSVLEFQISVLVPVNSSFTQHRKFVNWKALNEESIQNYYQTTQDLLINIRSFDEESEPTSEITRLYEHILSSLRLAEDKLSYKKKRRQKQISGWNRLG